MAKITTTRYVVQRLRIAGDYYIDCPTVPHLEDAKSQLLWYRTNGTSQKYRLIVRQELEEVIG